MTSIGITCSYRSTPVSPKRKSSLQRYSDSLADAGAEGVPLWRPREDDDTKIAARAERLAAKLDGLLVSGGSDLSPEIYGETIHPQANVTLVHRLRPSFETHLIRAMRERGKPIFGICYGCQFFNVSRGGTLLQDIPLQHPEPMPHRNARHTVRVERGSLLEKIVGQDEFEVASYHHQAISRPATGTRITAWAPDGVIEAIELDENPFWLGVQWHPEYDRESEATGRLFSAFISACRK